MDRGRGRPRHWKEKGVRRAPPPAASKACIHRSGRMHAAGFRPIDRSNGLPLAARAKDHYTLLGGNPMDMEKLVKFIREENEETRRHFDVVAEGLRSDIRLLAEGHGALVEKVDHLDAKVDRLETKVDHLETRMDGLETKVDHLETRMDGFEAKLDDFIVETRTNFDEVRASIKFSYAELDRRITFLETGFKELSARVASIETRQMH